MIADKPPVARKALGGGRWFPGRAPVLKEMVETFIDEAKPAGIKDRLVAAIAPHAGYVYSGRVAGHTFRALKDNAAAGHKPETVVVLGFSHRMGFQGVALMDGGTMVTPLGSTDLDRESAAFLVKTGSRIRMDYAPHAGEHSAENEIPFVQVALPDSKLVVGIIGDHGPATITDLVNALAKLAKEKKIVVVASTDLLHDADYDLVTKTDKATLKQVGAMDHAGILKAWDYSHQVMCGVAPVVAAMRFAETQGCKQGTVLFSRNSGDDHPESRGSWVVGYAAVVFAAPGKAQ